MWRVVLEKNLKLIDFNENDRDFSFFLRYVLFTLSDLVPNQRGDKYVQNGLQLEEVSHSLVTIDELGFLLKLLHVNIG